MCVCESNTLSLFWFEQRWKSLIIAAFVLLIWNWLYYASTTVGKPLRMERSRKSIEMQNFGIKCSHMERCGRWQTTGYVAQTVGTEIEGPYDVRVSVSLVKIPDSTRDCGGYLQTGHGRMNGFLHKRGNMKHQVSGAPMRLSRKKACYLAYLLNNRRKSFNCQMVLYCCGQLCRSAKIKSKYYRDLAKFRQYILLIITLKQHWRV